MLRGRLRPVVCCRKLRRHRSEEASAGFPRDLPNRGSTSSRIYAWKRWKTAPRCCQTRLHISRASLMRDMKAATTRYLSVAYWRFGIERKRRSHDRSFFIKVSTTLFRRRPVHSHHPIWICGCTDGDPVEPNQNPATALVAPVGIKRVMYARQLYLRRRYAAITWPEDRRVADRPHPTFSNRG